MMFNDKQLDTFVRAINGFIDEKKSFKNPIDEYEYVKKDIELEIGNRAIAAQMG